jgi:Na+-transporting NADH:ubiquinone oxidoreductase subunit NqrF
MTTRRKVAAHPPPADWTISTHFVWNSRHMEPGTELSIIGQRGRFRFMRHVRTSTSEWIDVVGGKSGMERMRSFYPDKIKTVHRLTRMRKSA